MILKERQPLNCPIEIMTMLLHIDPVQAKLPCMKNPKLLKNGSFAECPKHKACKPCWEIFFKGVNK